MKGFLDTSSLCKKYIEEEGSEVLEKVLEQLTEVIVSPICWLEINSAFARRLHERTITYEQVVWISAEIKKDFSFFGKVLWNETLEDKSVEFIKKYNLRTLDSLQLAAGYLAKIDLFITSDKRLFSVAQRELKNVKLI